MVRKALESKEYKIKSGEIRFEVELSPRRRVLPRDQARLFHGFDRTARSSQIIHSTLSGETWDTLVSKEMDGDRCLWSPCGCPLFDCK